MQKNQNRYPIEQLKEEFKRITTLDLLDEGQLWEGKNDYATLILNTENDKFLEGNIELPNIDNINLSGSETLQFYTTKFFIPQTQNQLRLIGFKFLITEEKIATSPLQKIKYFTKIN